LGYATPATFRKAIDIILSGLKWGTCLVYLDDIIMYSTSREDHYHHVDEVLTTLGKAGLSLKLKNITSSRTRSTTSAASFGQVVWKLRRRTPLPSKRPSLQRLKMSSSGS
jgi:hypothetical protein